MSASGSTRALADDLARLVGSEHVLSGSAARPYETDATANRGLRGHADAVVVPANVEEVASVMAWSYERGVPLVPRGGGTGLAGGAVPVDGGVVLSMERFDKVVEVAAERWRITTQAGVTTQTVRRLARESGLFFPPDPGAAEQSQIGGNVATNAGGPHAFKYGATGAWVTGIEALTPPGTVVRFGGEQRKDVGGYDLKDLLIGSEGTLAVITSVVLRLLPAPEQTLALVLFFGSLEDGVKCAGEILACGMRAAALDYLDERTMEIVSGSYPGEIPADSKFALIVELDGGREEVAQQRQDLDEITEGLALAVDEPVASELWRWRDGVSGAVATVMGGKVSEDVVVPPRLLAEAIRRLDDIGEEFGLPTCSWGHAGDGNMHATFLVDPDRPETLAQAEHAADSLFGMAVELGGGVSGEHGIGYLKRGQLARQWNEEAIELQERVKEMFDPRDLLNPGKKLARV